MQQAVKHSLALLRMGKKLPETCWADWKLINCYCWIWLVIYIVYSNWSSIDAIGVRMNASFISERRRQFACIPWHLVGPELCGLHVDGNRPATAWRPQRFYHDVCSWRWIIWREWFLLILLRHLKSSSRCPSMSLWHCLDRLTTCTAPLRCSLQCRPY